MIVDGAFTDCPNLKNFVLPTSTEIEELGNEDLIKQ